MHFLYTVLYTFPTILTGIICLKIKVSFVGHHFVAPMTFLFAATVRINEILFNNKK